MIRTHKIEIPIYHQYIYFLFGDPSEVKDYLNSVYGTRFDFDEKVSDAVTLHKNLVSWIWFDEDCISIPVIVHEISHAVFDIMLDLGLELTDQEVFCYLIQYIMEECKNIFAIQMDPICRQSTQEDGAQSS